MLDRLNGGADDRDANFTPRVVGDDPGGNAPRPFLKVLTITRLPGPVALFAMHHDFKMADAFQSLEVLASLGLSEVGGNAILTPV